MDISGDVGSFDNSGHIIAGADEYGVYFDGVVTTANNSGTIEGKTGIYYDNAAGTVLSNSGTIIGYGGTAVHFNSGDDTLNLLTGGNFLGMVDFGGGSNTFDFSSYHGNMVFGYASGSALTDVAGSNMYYDNGADTVYIVSGDGIKQAPQSVAGPVSNIADIIAGLTGGGVGGASNPALGYAEPKKESRGTKAIDTTLVNPAPFYPNSWATAFGGGDHIGDAAGTQNTYAGVLGGLQTEFWGGLTLGVAFGYSHGNLQIDHGPQTIGSDMGVVGAYAKKQYDALTLEAQLHRWL